MDVIGVVRAPVATYAAAYLERRELIAAWLAENDVEWGGTLLDAARAAARARVTPSTWRAYVARNQAPAGDHDGQWRPATHRDAWMTSTGPACATEDSSSDPPSSPTAGVTRRLLTARRTGARERTTESTRSALDAAF